ncbi:MULTISPECIES: LysR family transcriptional regulator [Pseudomonas]|uniref:LysR family transcriptional regulator n=1 Tax=Pseudomonas TaxID=286 RepID=UPI000C880009|nr:MULTISPECIES: LysR family transcriptional regulator [Pseudomonas]MDF9757019.1 DNA-binding transcriptional LysR family regulator [Pseudomonas hunanensis]PMZ89291.1 LysR family transcriptional regulator [Pseudomonas sp. FW305-42]PNA24906.1 LysR family transcriptional regulator [Pseudomonas sp. MPR-R1B]PNB21775.1 LysR family transcriptional regulator [Pseudomonas sp. DP16D-E2]PNB41144.1 LysR family transcriptional regulator [Pseudomonas sp. FW305-17]
MLDNLALFLTIIEKGSLSAAGRERGLSPATVSERLAALEAHYGVALLTRSTRSLSLTDAGRQLAEGARRLLAEADELESRLRDGQQKISGLVRLSAPVDLGQHCIVPLLDRFLAEHPQVSIDLDLTDGYVDLVGQGIDFAIRYGTLADSSLRARPLGDNRRVVCAAPDYLHRHGTPLHPDDLAHHDCIVMRFGIHAERVWPFRLDGAAYPVGVRGRRVANSGEQVRRWALDGHGLCLKSLRDVRDDLDNGRLVEVLEDFSAGQVALQIVYAPTRVQPRRVRALMEAIIEGLR